MLNFGLMATSWLNNKGLVLFLINQDLFDQVIHPSRSAEKGITALPLLQPVLQVRMAHIPIQDLFRMLLCINFSMSLMALVRLLGSII